MSAVCLLLKEVSGKFANGLQDFAFDWNRLQNPDKDVPVASFSTYFTNMNYLHGSEASVSHWWLVVRNNINRFCQAEVAGSAMASEHKNF